MRRRLWLFLSVLFAFTLVAAACGDDDDSADTGDDAADDAGDDSGDEGGDDGGCDRTGSAANPIKPDDTTSDVDASDVTVAFVYLTDPGDAGWTWAHHRGAEQAAAATGATLLTVENIVSGTTHDVWEVNVEAEYHEELSESDE